jgi:riboflavin transporter FmnP
MRNSRLQLMTRIGVLSALAMIAYFIDFPILPAAPYLKMDLSDIPAIIGAFAFGPVAGIFIELIKNILHFIVKSETGGVGELANFLSGAAFVVAASLIYFRNKKRSSAIIGLALGTILMTIVMIFANYFIMLPLYMPALFQGPKSVIYNLILTTTLPFNILKGVIVSVVTMLIYKRLSPILHKQ